MAHELGQHGAKSSFEKNRHGSTQGYAATKTGHTFSTIDLKGGLQNIGGQVQKIIDLEWRAGCKQISELIRDEMSW